MSKLTDEIERAVSASKHFIESATTQFQEGEQRKGVMLLLGAHRSLIGMRFRIERLRPGLTRQGSEALADGIEEDIVNQLLKAISGD